MNDDYIAQFETHRPLMFSIAYRMLGSASDAEDIVQEAYLRYQGAAHTAIVSHKAFLSTIVTRLCLNHLQSARSQRESYIGPWLPEPIMTDRAALSQPGARVELHESLALAFLVLLEQLSPLERAVFLLRDVFDYDYSEIAAILEREEATCRQLLRRARQHIAAGRPRFKPSPDEHRRLLTRFIQAVGGGDVGSLTDLLAEDVTLWADGGGKVRGALRTPLQGAYVVARFLVGISRSAGEALQPEIQDVNTEPAIVLHVDGVVRLVIVVSAEDGCITTIRTVGNPDKLHWVNLA